MLRGPKAAGALRWARFGVMVGAALGMGLGCGRAPSLEETAAKPARTAAVLEKGRALYQRQCAACHGPDGKGDGAAAYLLYPKPRDFTQNEFRLVSTTTQQVTDEDLFLTLTRGMPGSAMPPWETLKPQERWALVYFVRSLAEGDNPQPVDPGSVIQPPQEPAGTAARIERGRRLFAEACASCHGPQGKGDGRQQMTDNAGFPIRPRDLTAGVFKGSSESGDLYRRIVAGLPGSPMPSYAGVYTEAQIWDLVHYVQSLVPPGVEERIRMRPRSIRARRIQGAIPSDPAAPAWAEAEPVTVALTPLWWRNERAEVVEVKALHNGEDLAFHLRWNDPTRDSAALTPQAFSDGAAVQFSTEADPPFFGMGDSSAAVQIWHWKASWQEDLGGWKDIESEYPDAAVDWYPGQSDYRHGEPFEVSRAKTASQDPQSMAGWGAENPLSSPQRPSAAEEAWARGLGTLTSRPPALQRVQAEGLWREGRWQVVLRRPLALNEKNGLLLRPGRTVRTAFAVWDGRGGDRNGQKSVSIWNVLQLER